MNKYVFSDHQHIQLIWGHNGLRPDNDNCFYLHYRMMKRPEKFYMTLQLVEKPQLAINEKIAVLKGIRLISERFTDTCAFRLGAFCKKKPQEDSATSLSSERMDSVGYFSNSSSDGIESAFKKCEKHYQDQKLSDESVIQDDNINTIIAQSKSSSDKDAHSHDLVCSRVKDAECVHYSALYNIFEAKEGRIWTGYELAIVDLDQPDILFPLSFSTHFGFLLKDYNTEEGRRTYHRYALEKKDKYLDEIFFMSANKQMWSFSDLLPSDEELEKKHYCSRITRKTGGFSGVVL